MILSTHSPSLKCKALLHFMAHRYISENLLTDASTGFFVPLLS